MASRAQDAVEGTSQRGYSVSWFALAVVFSSAILLLQILAGLDAIPATTLFQGLLFLQLLAILTSSRRPAYGPGSVAVLLLLGTSVAALVHASIAETNTENLARSYLFMYSLGLASAVYVAGPAHVRLTKPMRGAIAAAIAFGVAQAVFDDLLLPQAFKDHYGIVYERFVNDRVRVLSVFPSAPRFAELLALVIVTSIGALLVRASRPAWRNAAIVIASSYALFHTYSRSGYILAALATFFLLLFIRPTLRASGRRGPDLAYLTTGGFLLGAAVYLAFAPSENLAIADSTSLEARLGHWTSLRDQFDTAGTSAYFFGTGRSAFANILQRDYFVVDNVFYAFIYFAGFFGLAALAFLYLVALRGLRRLHAEQPHLIPLTAFLCALPFEGLFLDNHNTLLLTLFIALGVINRYRYVIPSPSSPRSERANA
jgi:hypothetical protein